MFRRLLNSMVGISIRKAEVCQENVETDLSLFQ